MNRISLIEPLEVRQLLSGANIANGVLRVAGDRLLANSITVQNDTDGTDVDVTIVSSGKGAKTVTYSNKFALSSITAVHIFGGARADTINVGQANGPFTLPTTVDGGRGDDTITTGGESDTIFGGFGDDKIADGDGNDAVYGGPGDDTIASGNGDDKLWGGLGNDDITAGNGTDTLGGALGKNTLMGGTGHDTFYVRKLSNNVNNYDSSKDTLKITALDHDPATSGDPAAANI